jgi:glycosyltransferase involved in cell wall biosynthesis
MRIAHIITRMIVGGAQENTLLNCRDLVEEHGDDVLLITGPPRGPEGSLLDQSPTPTFAVEVIPTLRRAVNPFFDVPAYFAIKRALRKFKPDVVHTHSAKGGILGRAAAWTLKIPVVVHTVHGAPFYPQQGRAGRALAIQAERWAARRCQKLISVADAMTDLLVDAGVAPREKFTTIYSGMEVAPFLAASQGRAELREKLGYKDDEIVVGKIARLFHLKGHEYLLAAAPRVIQQCPNIRFLLVGDGILREKLQRQIKAAGLVKYFRFTGLVPPTEIPQLLGATDIVIHLSLREGLARVLPQALIAGRPVVSYDIDGAREVVRSGETGFLLPPQSVEPLIDALVRLAGDRALRERLARAGQGECVEKFDHRQMTQRIRELYGELMRDGG